MNYSWFGSVHDDLTLHRKHNLPGISGIDLHRKHNLPGISGTALYLELCLHC